MEEISSGCDCINPSMGISWLEGRLDAAMP